MNHEQLRALALRTKPLVDGSTRSLSAFYSAMSPDRTLGLLDENERLRGLLREALPRLVKGIVYDKIEQELSK